MTASIANNSYSAASGQAIACGRYYAPSWAASLSPMAWTELTGTNFLTWANANIPAGAYQGNFPFEAIIDAYSDGYYDEVNRKSYLAGGGHGDGTCNAVVTFNAVTLAYTLAGTPTPPSKYPPSYVNGGTTQPGPLVYPSGAGPFSHFRNDLTNPADTVYNTPLARATTHQYMATAVRNGVLHYFYGSYAEFNSATGLWTNVDSVDFGAQIYAFNSNFGSSYIQQGTAALYDSQTDKFYVTLVPGDFGGGWRSHLMQINPTTRTIEAMWQITNYQDYPMLSASSIYQIGRKIWCFLINNYNSANGMDTGVIFDIDTHDIKYFRMSGDLMTLVQGSTIEAIPGVHYNGSWYRWNYADATDKNYFHKASTTPVSGTGTKADPYVFAQTKVAVSGAPTDCKYIYRRLWRVGDSVLLLPRGNSDIYAIKLT